MNITDVGHLTSDADDGEDKLEKWAKREWISVWEVAKKYENIFMKGMKALNIDTFDVMPKATDHIAEQISLIQKLEEKAYTYEVPGDWIYMDTSKVENYWELMWPNYKKRLEDLNAWIRVDMWGKKNPTDFALWKFAPQNEKRQMEWDSPRWIWFPGWHIECSAMSSKYLGEQFDIHHWWADHITIHHPNEIAQSECGFGVHPWVKYWVHNEFLQVDWGKMSKSLWNVYTLEDVQKRWYSPLDLKYFYFMAQYSNFQNFTWEQLDVAKNTRQALIKKLQWREELKDRKEFENDPFFKEAMEAVSDNINTPKLLAIIQSSLNNVNENTYAIITFFENNFLKLWLFEEQEKVEIPSEVQELAQKRREAKKNKDWGTADSLRDQLTSLWWKILDRPDGFEVEKI